MTNKKHSKIKNKTRKKYQTPPRCHLPLRLHSKSSRRNHKNKQRRIPIPHTRNKTTQKNVNRQKKGGSVRVVRDFLTRKRMSHKENRYTKRRKFSHEALSANLIKKIGTIPLVRQYASIGKHSLLLKDAKAAQVQEKVPRPLWKSAPWNIKKRAAVALRKQYQKWEANLITFNKILYSKGHIVDQEEVTNLIDIGSPRTDSVVPIEVYIDLLRSKLLLANLQNSFYSYSTLAIENEGIENLEDFIMEMDSEIEEMREATKSIGRAASSSSSSKPPPPPVPLLPSESSESPAMRASKASEDTDLKTQLDGLKTQLDGLKTELDGFDKELDKYEDDEDEEFCEDKLDISYPMDSIPGPPLPPPAAPPAAAAAPPPHPPPPPAAAAPLHPPPPPVHEQMEVAAEKQSRSSSTSMGSRISSFDTTIEGGAAASPPDDFVTSFFNYLIPSSSTKDNEPMLYFHLLLIYLDRLHDWHLGRDTNAQAFR